MYQANLKSSWTLGPHKTPSHSEVGPLPGARSDGGKVDPVQKLCWHGTAKPEPDSPGNELSSHHLSCDSPLFALHPHPISLSCVIYSHSTSMRHRGWGEGGGRKRR